MFLHLRPLFPVAMASLAPPSSSHFLPLFSHRTTLQTLTLLRHFLPIPNSSLPLHPRRRSSAAYALPNHRRHHQKDLLPPYDPSEEEEEEEDDDDDDDDEAAEEYDEAALASAVSEEDDDGGDEEFGDRQSLSERSESKEGDKLQRVERLLALVRELGEDIVDFNELASIYDFPIDKFQVLIRDYVCF